MLALKIYNVLNRYRKNPYHLVYDSSPILAQIQTMIDGRLPLTLVLPGCHGKIDHPDLTIDHMPDLAEFLGIERFAKMCAELEEIYPHGARLFMLHEGHFYVDTPLIRSDETMNEYLAKLRTMLKPHPCIRSIGLQEFFPTLSTLRECREEFFKRYVPETAVLPEVHSKYQERFVTDFHYSQTAAAEAATKQLRIWLGFRNLLQDFFADTSTIRLSSVYKEPNDADKIAVNYLPYHHIETPSFHCVVKEENGNVRFIKRKEALARNLILSEHLGFKFYQEKK